MRGKKLEMKEGGVMREGETLARGDGVHGLGLGSKRPLGKAEEKRKGQWVVRRARVTSDVGHAAKAWRGALPLLRLPRERKLDLA